MRAHGRRRSRRARTYHKSGWTTLKDAYRRQSDARGQHIHHNGRRQHQHRHPHVSRSCRDSQLGVPSQMQSQDQHAQPLNAAFMVAGFILSRWPYKEIVDWPTDAVCNGESHGHQSAETTVVTSYVANLVRKCLYLPLTKPWEFLFGDLAKGCQGSAGEQTVNGGQRWLRYSSAPDPATPRTVRRHCQHYKDLTRLMGPSERTMPY